jgi:hypothetical protein
MPSRDSVPSVGSVRPDEIDTAGLENADCCVEWCAGRCCKKNPKIASALLLVVFGIKVVVLILDLYSDFDVWNSIKDEHTRELHQQSSARLNLTNPNSHYAAGSPQLQDLAKMYAALPEVVQKSTCDPSLAADALASEDWDEVAVTLQRLQIAAFVVLIISLLVDGIAVSATAFLLCRSCRQVRRGFAKDSGDDRAFELVGIVAVFIVQVFEDVPQSVIQEVYVATLLFDRQCNQCFRASIANASFFSNEQEQCRLPYAGNMTLDLVLDTIFADDGTSAVSKSGLAFSYAMIAGMFHSLRVPYSCWILTVPLTMNRAVEQYQSALEQFPLQGGFFKQPARWSMQILVTAGCSKHAVVIVLRQYSPRLALQSMSHSH